MGVKKVYVIGGGQSYIRWIDNAVLTQDIREADIAILIGGADINPAIYGRECLSVTGYSDRCDARDAQGYDAAIAAKVPLIIGICRGFQYAAARNGAILAQDVTSHWTGATHGMTNGKEIYEITSLHHQMVYPFTMPKDKYEILFWASPARSRHYVGLTEEEIDKMTCEPEVVLIKPNNDTKILGIQGHPEMMAYHGDGPTLRMFNRLIEEYLNNDN